MSYAITSSLGNFSLSDQIIADFDEQMLSNCLDKRSGGIVSGDMTVENADLNLLCGNYIQVTDPEKSYNYSSKNAFIQAEEAFSGSGKSYGPASTGSYGYCILSVVNGTNHHGLKLSGDISKLTALLDNNAPGAGINYDYSASKSLKVVLNDTIDISNALFSLALGDQGETMSYQISSIDRVNNIVYLKQSFSTATAGLTSLTEAQCIDLWENDDNAFYVAGFPEIGNSVVKNFYAQHVEGGSSRAVGKYTHAEGRDNIADVRYSHAEGSHNIAANMASHAEGFQNIAAGRYSHVEGYLNEVRGKCSHAEGNQTSSFGESSHAEGKFTRADSNYSHAEGISSIAAANYAHAEGTSVSAFGVASHAEGARAYAKGPGAHAEGGDTTATGEKSHAEGINTTASGNDSHAEGNLTVASGAHSHAEGSSTAAAGSTSHAEGYLVKAVGYAGHAEGQSTIAKGDQSHSEGAGSSTLQSFKVSGAANSKTYTTDKNHSLHVNNIVQYDKTYAKIVSVPGVSSFTLDQTLDSINDLTGANINLIKGIAYSNKSHVEGQNSIATGETSHAEGGATLAAGKFSHSEGYKTEANGVYSHAAGVSAITNANCSYVWNGLSSVTYEVSTTDVGTFNINPKNGLAGFYIGHHSLIENSLPVSGLSTVVVYNTGEISTILIEGELLSSSIPNIKNAVDVTIGNAVTRIGVKAFFQCNALTCIQMPNSLTAIMNTAFSRCPALTSLTFPDSVLSIDYSGFSNCTNLRTVKFPNRLTKLTDYVSYNCPKLVDVVIPNTISSIGKQCFMDCTGLIHINIPSSVTTIGLSAFTHCSSLTSVEFEYRTLEQISTISNYSTRWGLVDNTAIKPYDWSQTAGYFNVNPNDGLSGFYIGKDNFIQCVLSAVQKMSDAQKNALKTALGLS